jgi:putative membrane protein
MLRTRAGLGLALASIVITGCGAWSASGPQTDTSAGRPAGVAPAGGVIGAQMPGQPPRPKDDLFLAQAAHANASEIELSRIAVDRARSQEAKDYARMIMEDHRRASQQLIDLAQRKAHPLPSVPSAGVVQKTDQMQRGKADTFDLDYTTRMRDDHLRALSMHREVAATSPDADIRAWAASQVPILEGHLKHAESLLDNLSKTAKATP